MGGLHVSNVLVHAFDLKACSILEEVNAEVLSQMNYSGFLIWIFHRLSEEAMP